MMYNIGKQFSLDPAGRYYTDGDSSGEKFREEILVPNLRTLSQNEKFIIILDDGIEGYGSSFLSEAFGGLVKYGYFEKDFLLKTLEFNYCDRDFNFYEERIKSYINNSKFNSSTYESTKK